MDRITHLFPLLAIAAGVVAYLAPGVFTPYAWAIVLAGAALAVVAAVVLHNLIGFAGGYFIPRWLGFDRLTCRTLSIEVGMQNSGLSVALALKFFAPPAALPGAIFSIWHNIGGAVLAGYWASRLVESPSEAARSG